MMQPTSTPSRQITNQTIGDIIPNARGICPRIVGRFASNPRQPVVAPILSREDFVYIPMQASEIVARDESSGRQGD
jgi:hypothetical protein